jgi:hypothetical protein
MLDQILDTFRKASESSLRMQQDVFKTFTQQWAAPFTNVTGTSPAGENAAAIQKRFVALSLEMLKKHREALDSAYASGIQIFEQAARLADVKSPEDFRRVNEDLWRKFTETYKAESEARFRDFQKWMEESFLAAQKTKPVPT